MYKLVYFIFLAVFILNCQTIPLKSEPTVYEVKASAKELYDRALVYLSKNTRDIKQAIRLEDNENYHLISAISINCFSLMGNYYLIDYILELKFKNNRFLINLERPVTSVISIFDGTKNIFYYQSDFSIKKYKECKEQYITELQQILSNRKTNDWNF